MQRQANEHLPRFAAWCEEDGARAQKESNEKWKEFKAGVEKGDSIGFRLIKAKHQVVWTGDQDVSNVAQLRGQAKKWQDLWQGGSLGHQEGRAEFGMHKGARNVLGRANKEGC